MVETCIPRFFRHLLNLPLLLSFPSLNNFRSDGGLQCLIGPNGQVYAMSTTEPQLGTDHSDAPNASNGGAFPQAILLPNGQIVQVVNPAGVLPQTVPLGEASAAGAASSEVVAPEVDLSASSAPSGPEHVSPSSTTSSLATTSTSMASTGAAIVSSSSSDNTKKKRQKSRVTYRAASEA